MSEKQPWRPPLAPKPATNTLLPPINAQARDPSPALRGASLAFSAPSRKSTLETQNPNVHSNAALAAAAAGKARPPQAQGTGHDTHRTASPVRGRSQLTPELDQAARNLQASALATDPVSSRPLPSRTTSQLAARAASSRSSPARSSEPAASRAASPQRRLHRLVSREAAGQVSGRTTTENGDNAVRGAAASMSISPTPVHRSPFANASGKLDLSKISSLASTNTINSPQSTSKASASAARAANFDADLRVKEAARRHVSSSPPRHRFASIPSPPPPRQLSAAPVSVDSNHTHSPPLSVLAPEPMQEDEAVAAVPYQSPIKRSLPVPIPPPPRKTSPAHATSSNTPDNDRGRMTADSLANAMVASSLASSRVQSPAPARKGSKPPPPIPHRRSRSLHDRGPASPPEPPRLKPMPVRPMRQTLRKHSPKDTDDDDVKRGRKHILRKHPNKHHEGDRKRWRDKVTERERKRYEGLWAANKGILHEYEPSPSASSSDTTDRHRAKPTVLSQDLVINVVVRDIWDRSRLPRDVLEEIWDLVTTDEDSKALGREEFVVGLWLIDQRLKGRKLPVKVSSSVWSSVRHTQGVKISSKPL